MRPLPLLLIGVALLLLAAAPAAGVVAMPCLGLPDRAVGVLNAGPDPVDLTGWTITDDGIADTCTFPGFTLASWEMVVVHAGSGTNSATDLYWGRGPGDAAAWNRDGDLVTLWNASGTRIADSRGFILGAPTFTPVPALPLVTMTRLPGHPILSPIPTPYLTTAPAGCTPYGPCTIAPPYPTTIRTLAPGQTTLPVPYQQPQWALPTGTPRPVLLPVAAPASPIRISRSIPPGVKPRPGGKRYAIGNPGSLLGTRFGLGRAATPTGTVRTVSTDGNHPRPGSVSFGITPPSSGSFVRWYPASRWAAGLK